MLYCIFFVYIILCDFIIIISFSICCSIVPCNIAKHVNLYFYIAYYIIYYCIIFHFILFDYIHIIWYISVTLWSLGITNGDLSLKKLVFTKWEGVAVGRTVCRQSVAQPQTVDWNWREIWSTSRKGGGTLEEAGFEVSWSGRRRGTSTDTPAASGGLCPKAWRKVLQRPG